MSKIKINNLSINNYVKDKMARYNETSMNFESLFTFMFSEKDLVMYEKTEGFIIKKTTYGQSYNSILGKTICLSKLLADVPKGSVIGLAMDNSLDWIENFWTIIRAGYNPLLVNLRLSDNVLEKVFEDMDVRACISDSKEYSVKTIYNNQILVCDDNIECKNNDYGTLMYVMSSGTTDNVKCCAYSSIELSNQINDSYKVILENKAIKQHFKGQLKLLLFLPLYHIYAFAAVYLWFGFFSRTFVELNDMAPQTILNTIRKHEVTHIFAVPMFWNKVYKQAQKAINDRGEATVNKFKKANSISVKIADAKPIASAFRNIAFKEVKENLFGNSVKYMITGGSDIDPEVISFFNAIGYPLTNGYGMSEIGITSFEVNPNKKYFVKGSIGKPLSSNQYRINKDGVLEVKSVSSAQTIICGKEHLDRPEWFVTGDLAHELEGHYYIDGRFDDLVIGESGENLNPVIIEKYFEYPGINEVCLTQIDNKAVLVFSVKRNINKNEYDSIKLAINQIMNESNLNGQISKIVYTISEFTDEQHFKLNRRYIAKRLKNNDLEKLSFEDKSKEEKLDEIELFVKETIAEIIGISIYDFSIDDDFYNDIGGSSLDFYNAFAIVVEKYDLNITVNDCKEIKTPKEFCKLIEDRL